MPAITVADIADLRVEVERLAGEPPPVDASRRSLETRLRALRKRVALSMSVRHADELALARIAADKAPERRGGRPSRDGGTANISALARIALAEYARNHGYNAEADILCELVSS